MFLLPERFLTSFGMTQKGTFARGSFVTNPVLTEAVNAVSFREDLLVFLFYIATLTLYITIRKEAVHGVRPTILILYLLSCALYFLALFSKEMAVTLPLTVYCYEWVYYKTNLRSLLFNPFNIGYIVITLIYGYIRFYYFYNPDAMMAILTPPWDLNERLFTLPWLLLSHLKVTAFPVSLATDHIIHPIKSIYSTSFVTPIIALALLLSTVFVSRKNRKEVIFGALFFIITLIPVYNVTPIVMPFAERYLYLPSVGFIIVGGSFIYHIYEALSPKTNERHYVCILFLFILCLYSSMTIMRNTVWNNDYLFWSDAVRKMPKSARAHHNIGTVYADQGKLDEAIREFKTALRLNPYDPRYRTSLAIAYVNQGKLDEALHEFQNVVRISPNYPESHYNLGIAYLNVGSRDKARQEFERALKLNPDYHRAQQALESID